MKRITIMIDDEKLRQEFGSCNANTAKARMAEAELVRQFIHQAVELNQREFMKWHQGAPSILTEPKKRKP